MSRPNVYVAQRHERVRGNGLLLEVTTCRAQLSNIYKSKKMSKNVAGSKTDAKVKLIQSDRNTVSESIWAIGRRTSAFLMRTAQTIRRCELHTCGRSMRGMPPIAGRL